MGGARDEFHLAATAQNRETRQTHPNARSQNGVKRTGLSPSPCNYRPSLAPVTDVFSEIRHNRTSGKRKCLWLRV